MMGERLDYATRTWNIPLHYPASQNERMMMMR
jgi:hypothetical protein